MHLYISSYEGQAIPSTHARIYFFNITDGKTAAGASFVYYYAPYHNAPAAPRNVFGQTRVMHFHMGMHFSTRSLLSLCVHAEPISNAQD